MVAATFRAKTSGVLPWSPPGIEHGLVVAGAACELCVFARRRRHWLAEQRRRRDAAEASVTLPVPLVPEDNVPEDNAPLTSPRRRQSHEAHTA